MLSKSQARTFFIGGTGLFSAFFIALGLDSMNRVPVLRHAENLMHQVGRAKRVWEKNHCKAAMRALRQTLHPRQASGGGLAGLVARCQGEFPPSG